MKPWLAIAIVFGAMCLAPLTVRAQRVEFPNPVASPYPPPGGLPSPASTYGASVAPPPPTFDPYSIPSAPPQLSAPYLPPGTSPYPPSPAGPYAPAAPYTYGGSPSALYPDGVQVYNGPFEPFTSTWTKTMRFFQEIHVDETWEARGGGENAMGINTINTWATFAIPFGWTPNPLLLTPGFQLNLWDGPDATGPTPATLPGQTYGAYLDVAWSPQISNWFGAELEISPGIYSDFSHTNSESFRILGRGLAVLTATPTLQFKAGVWYIDRVEIKLLPAGGVVWTPNPASRYEIFFPAPKLAHLCSTIGNHNVWAYIRGEYGGGAWTVERPVFGGNDQFEYDDIRVAIGVDFLPETQNGLRGYLEVGYAFDRQLVYRSRMPSKVDITDAVLVGGGLSY
jgi:hypothetical protein